MQPRKLVGYAFCLIALLTATDWVLAQSQGAAGAQVARGRPARGERYLLYAASPGTAGGGAAVGAGILVFDVRNNWRFVKRIPTFDIPAWQNTEYDEVKGMEVSAETGLLYLATLTGLSAFDLITEKMVWEQTYEGRNCCDRLSQSPDGKILYVPERSEKRGQDGWLVVDGITGKLIKRIDTPQSRSSHNTIYSVDGSRVFMAGTSGRHVSVADTKTHTLVQTVGPFSNVVRPFTVNGRGTLVFVNLNELLGFEVGDVATGKMIHRVEVPGYGWTRDRIMGEFTPSHGIAMSPDEKEIWLSDTVHPVVHVFDATVMPPKWTMAIKLPPRSRPGEVFDADGRQRTADMHDYVYWVTFGLDGKYVYVSTGHVIDAATKQIVGTLNDEFGRPVRSEKIAEVLFRDGKPVRASDQFGYGQVLGRPTNP